MREATDLPVLIKLIEKALREVMFADKSVLFMVDQNENIIYKFDDDGEKVVYPLETGILGSVAQSGGILNIANPYIQENYNPKVDLDTQLPILCLPIKSTKESGKILAVSQVLDLKVAGRVGGKHDLLESEIIREFQIQVAMCLENLIKPRFCKER